eukprot:3294679-Pyramimonas_sp.AAC.1
MIRSALASRSAANGIAAEGHQGEASSPATYLRAAPYNINLGAWDTVHINARATSTLTPA